MDWELLNGTIVTPGEIIQKGGLTISGNKIADIQKKSDGKAQIQIDLNSLIVFPGLINGHDHLLGTYYPRVGDRRPYMNWLVWDNDLKASPIYAERQQIEASDLYQMGAFRHLLCGVTSVQDHIPHFVQDMFSHNLPIRLIDRYGVAHSVTSFALNWGDTIEKEHALATENNIPFVVHCSEGYDDETLKSVSVLNSKGALSRNTVLIHGIAFTDEDMKLLSKNQCNVVWCPSSNLFMFEKTARVKELMDQKINVCLGTDSPMSGSINIFQEIFTAKSYYERAYGAELKNKTIVEMLTTNPALAFSLPELGSLRPGNLADLLIIQGDKSDPYRALVEMNYEDVMLVVIDGLPRYGDESFIPLFDALDIKYQRIKVDSYNKVIAGDLLGLLNRIKTAVGFDKKLDFLPVEPWN